MKVIDNKKYQQLKLEEIDNNHFSSNDYCLSCALTITDEIKKMNFRDIVIVYDKGEIGDIAILVANMLKRYDLEIKTVTQGKDSFYTLDKRIKETINLRETRNVIRTSSLIIDCLFDGTFEGKTQYPYDNIIQWINESSAYVVSIDIPSGVISQEGKVLGEAVRANETWCFDYVKMGNVFSKGKECCGKIKILRSIFSIDALNRMPKIAEMYDDSEIKKLIKETCPISQTKKPKKVLLFNKEETGDCDYIKRFSNAACSAVMTMNTKCGDALKENLKNTEPTLYNLGVLLSGYPFEDMRLILNYFFRYSIPVVLNGEYLPYLINQNSAINNNLMMILVLNEEQYDVVFDRSNYSKIKNLKKLIEKYPNLRIIYRSNETLIIQKNDIVINVNGKQINESAECENMLCCAIAGNLELSDVLNSTITTEYIFSLANMLWCNKREYCMKAVNDLPELIPVVFDTLRR